MVFDVLKNTNLTITFSYIKYKKYVFELYWIVTYNTLTTKKLEVKILKIVKEKIWYGRVNDYSDKWYAEHKMTHLGMKNANGEWVVPPLFTSISNMQDGLYLATINNTICFIDSNGSVVLSNKKQNCVYSNFEDMIWWPEKDLYEIEQTYAPLRYSRKFKEINFDILQIENFYNGLSVVKTQNGFGLMDKNGNLIIDYCKNKDVKISDIEKIYELINANGAKILYYASNSIFFLKEHRDIIKQSIKNFLLNTQKLNLSKKQFTKLVETQTILYKKYKQNALKKLNQVCNDISKTEKIAKYEQIIDEYFKE